eukprot:NP_498133.3 Uncharacterized protein CELE_F52C9.5 [Caenorhabditis elegans]
MPSSHRLSATILIFLSLTYISSSSNLVEDITDKQDSSEDDDHLQTFPTPPPIGTTTASADSLFNRMNKILRKEEKQKSQNFQIFNEKDLVTNSNANPYFSTTRKPKNRSDSSQKARDPDPQNQVIAGIPDLSDPCFRRYENSIIVNAQPYERRSSTGLIHCKSHCLNSQIGVYSCRSFVYDNVNRVCDLFAHVGDQAPARLLKFQTQDEDSPPSPPPSAPIVALATNTDKRDEHEEMTETIEDITVASPSSDSCPRGKQSTFLRTEGFELFSHDDQELVVGDVAECAKACIENKINGVALKCKSFDFLSSTSTCAFTSEAAVPVGNGQLKQREDASYHEKICVSKSFVESCPSTFFSRHPQMILVGFAESVSDSPSFEHCFDTCLNSYQLFGFNCTSGMYYFEENQLNCILNSENRNTQRELFTEENTDIVDYFEVECTTPRSKQSKRKMAGVRNFETDAIGADKMVTDHEDVEEDGSKWESWSECQDGKQTRRKICANFNQIEDCAEEVRDCVDEIDSTDMRMSIKRAGELENNDHEQIEDNNTDASEDPVPTKEEIAEVKQKIRRTGFKCPLNECCRVFLSCSYGLRHNSHTKQLEWCRRPCDPSLSSFKRSRLLR